MLINFKPGGKFPKDATFCHGHGFQVGKPTEVPDEVAVKVLTYENFSAVEEASEKPAKKVAKKSSRKRTSKKR